MKYILLIYLNEKEWEGLSPALRAKGQFPSAAPLAPVATATTVREKDGKKVLTDGPFAETREQLGGYCLIDVKNLDEALEVAKRMHSTTVTSIEVRPLAEIAQ
ncbi:MAG TPA: YciI family protein [Bryobacteraceae bacterium]|nr:YciI family protein [Bryobacteraceae bacterium]